MSTEPTVDHPICLQEWGTAVVRCSSTIAARMHLDGHVAVSPLGDGHYTVRAKHKVGVLRYGPIELRIQPKVPVGRLLYLATYGHDERMWREVDTLLGEVTDPLSALAHALVRCSERALRPTPLQGYVAHDDALHGLRGRVAFARQIGSRAGVLLPVEVSFDEFELGITENRVLAAALDRVGRFVVSRDRRLTSRLTHLRAQLQTVRPWPAGAAVPSFSFNRLNERYRPALQLARLVLDGGSLEFPDATHMGSGFLIDMNRVFESYLTAVLTQRLERIGGRVTGQQTLHLDHANTVPIRPDISWWVDGTCRAVIDAKYKRTASAEVPNADLYQLLAYCTRLGLPRGWLIYADLDGEAGNTKVLRGSEIEIGVCQLPISGPLHTLASRADELAALITAREHCDERQRASPTQHVPR